MSRQRHFLPYDALARAAHVMAMRLLQSDRYSRLDAEQKGAVDMCIENYMGRVEPEADIADMGRSDVDYPEMGRGPQ